MTETDRKLRILFVTSDRYPPFRPAARAIFGEGLVARGHVIDWLIQAEKDCMTSYQTPYGNGTAYIAATNDGSTRWKRLKKHLLDLVNDLRMFRLISQNQYDLIQVKDKYLSALLAIVAGKIGKVRFFYWLAYPHGEASLYEAKEDIARYRYFYLLRGYFFKFVLYRIILPASDHIFVQSEQMKQDIAREGIPLTKMTPVPGSLNLADIPYSTVKDNLISDRPVGDRNVVYLGTLLRTRHLDFIVRVHAKVISTHPNAKLILVGKGEMPEDEMLLITEAERLGILESVVFVGHQPMSKAWEYIRNADVCLSPYYPTPILNSTSPTKLIEYMSMGKAVVGNDHPEQNLVISESGAGFCVPWDEEDFSKAISALLDDQNLASEMGARGRRYVEQHRTNTIMTTKIERQYYRMCSEQGHASVTL